MSSRWAVGLMTGTVLDGNIDVALLRSDGCTLDASGPAELVPYDVSTLALLQEAVDAARGWRFDDPPPGIFASAERALTEAQSQAVAEVLERSTLTLADVAVIGFHGQTVLHRPPVPGQGRGRTLQLGDGPLMARLLGRPVAYDFRAADMAAGGQGAPLAPIYHEALLNRLGNDGRSAVLNLGGVANLTWSDGRGRLIGFDTGPANAPINDLVRAAGAGNMDRDGRYAMAGIVDEDRLAICLAHPWLSAPYPKSLDRFDFSATMAAGLALEDGCALLTAFSAAAVGRALDLLPQRPERLVVCGGGRRNPALMQALRDRTAVEVIAAEAVGWRGDAVEAETFAFLALRALRGLPLSFPDTTGVARPTPGARLAGPTGQPLPPCDR